MKLMIIVVSALLMTACATPPQFIANFMDSRDKCQTNSRDPGEPLPRWCGAATGHRITVQATGPGTYLVNQR